MREGRLLRNCRVFEHRKIDVVAKECVGGCLPYPSRLSTPVTLTLALSRGAGEGSCPTVSPGFAMVSPSGIFAQPVWTGIVGVCRSAIPLCPSDISPASGGNPSPRPPRALTLALSRPTREGITGLVSLVLRRRGLCRCRPVGCRRCLFLGGRVRRCLVPCGLVLGF